METVADFIDRAFAARQDDGKLAAIREEVRDLASRFPMPH